MAFKDELHALVLRHAGEEGDQSVFLDLLQALTNFTQARGNGLALSYQAEDPEDNDEVDVGSYFYENKEFARITERLSQQDNSEIENTIKSLDRLEKLDRHKEAQHLFGGAFEKIADFVSRTLNEFPEALNVYPRVQLLHESGRLFRVWHVKNYVLRTLCEGNVDLAQRMIEKAVQVNRVMDRDFDEEVFLHKLSISPQRDADEIKSVISAIPYSEPATKKEISGAIGRPVSALEQILSRLDDLGYVERTKKGNLIAYQRVALSTALIE